jgi:hypothetical protein
MTDSPVTLGGRLVVVETDMKHVRREVDAMAVTGRDERGEGGGSARPS